MLTKPSQGCVSLECVSRELGEWGWEVVEVGQGGVDPEGIVALRSALCADCWHTDGPLHGSSSEEGAPTSPHRGGGWAECNSVASRCLDGLNETGAQFPSRQVLMYSSYHNRPWLVQPESAIPLPVHSTPPPPPPIH
ncbi:hypothetical protein INR49_001498 [Caranx melampygus]|nr:hypothetical protein INR49_001498 [Caranx melampygus]